MGRNANEVTIEGSVPVDIFATRKNADDPNQGYILTIDEDEIEISHEAAEKLGRFLLFEDNA